MSDYSFFVFNFIKFENSNLKLCNFNNKSNKNKVIFSLQTITLKISYKFFIILAAG